MLGSLQGAALLRRRRPHGAPRKSRTTGPLRRGRTGRRTCLLDTSTPWCAGSSATGFTSSIGPPATRISSFQPRRRLLRLKIRKRDCTGRKTRKQSQQWRKRLGPRCEARPKCTSRWGTTSTGAASRGCWWSRRGTKACPWRFWAPTPCFGRSSGETTTARLRWGKKRLKAPLRCWLPPPPKRRTRISTRAAAARENKPTTTTSAKKRRRMRSGRARGVTAGP
mmetsp:Transcript_29997/g.54426  ORF Transcript_29997/g.54426 Transcript_29997/m.54426 type:complete len:223 (+) Transcript_29997:203-871(+)